MKRSFARADFWLLFFIELFVASTVIGALFEISSDVDTGSIILLLVLALLFAGGTFFLYRIYDPFKEKYYFVQDTPLRFHKFFCYVSLPLGIILTLKSVADIVSAEDFPSNSFYFIDLSYSLASLVLMCVCFVGLRKLKSYAWRALMINYSLGVLYLFVVVIIYIIFSPFLLDSALASLMIYVYVSAIICLYYYKRKNLFLTPSSPIHAVHSSCSSVNSIPISDVSHIQNTCVPNVVEEKSTPNPISAPVISFCRNCGHKLSDESNYCSHCGTPVLKEW